MLCIGMIMTLLVSTTYIQFISQDSLESHPKNRRTVIEQIGRHRGAITAADMTLAESTPVDSQYAFQRRYPGNKVYAPVTGYFSIIPNMAGLEAAESTVLTGTDDTFFSQRISDMLIGKTPTGATVETTILPRAQQAAWDALGDQRGAVVAIDPSTGAILAMVSKPTYDPNVLAEHNRKQVNEAMTALNADPTRPLENRAIAGTLYPAGSTLKIIIAAAALESGAYSKDSVVPGPAALDLPGTSAVIRNASGGQCVNGTDEVPLITAFAKSCNTPFSYLGMEMGTDTVKNQATKFGFYDSLKVPMNVTPSSLGDQIDDKAVLAQTSLGERDVRVTPLQIAMLSAAVANNGVIQKPHLVKSVRRADQTIKSTTRPTKLHTPMSANTAAQLRTMMQAVVTEGTGKRAAIPGVTVAGKSGTAERSAGGKKLRPHTWFTAFAPAGDGEEAKVAVAVIVEEGGNSAKPSGGSVAGPIAQEVMKAVLGQ